MHHAEAVRGVFLGPAEDVRKVLVRVQKVLEEHLRDEQRDDDVRAERPVLLGLSLHGGDQEAGQALRRHLKGVGERFTLFNICVT